MINKSPRFQRTLEIANEPVSDIKHWENANDAFDKKEYKKSLVELIKYINPNVIEGDHTEGDINIVQGQGSVNVHIAITDNEFCIKVPFLKITDKTNRVALLRKVSEVNFESLTLAQIVLKDDILQFEYSELLELCHPHKIYGVIREIALYADDYDDMFVDRYDAEFLQKAEITPLSENEKKQINEYLDQIIEDYQNYSEALKGTRFNDFRWDIIVISILKLGVMPYVQGNLRTDLREYIYNMLNVDIDFDYRVDKGTNFMNKLSNTPREEILKDMYYAKQFVSLKRRCSLQILQDEIKSVDGMLQDYKNKQENMAVFYLLQITLLRKIFEFNVEKKYTQAIFDALEKSANIDIKDASKILLDVYNKILDGEISEKKEKKSGFFSRLFK